MESNSGFSLAGKPQASRERFENPVLCMGYRVNNAQGSSTTWKSTASHRLRPTGFTSKMWPDLVRIAVLTGLILLVVYSSALKFWRIQQSTHVSIRTLTADYSHYCNSFVSDSTKFNSCKTALDGAVVEANVKCQGYLEKEASCFSSQGGAHSNRCQSKTAAVDGCFGMICTSAVAGIGR